MDVPTTIHKQQTIPKLFFLSQILHAHAVSISLHFEMHHFQTFINAVCHCKI